MNTQSATNLVPDDQITDALGELVLDLHQPRRAWMRHVGEMRLMAAVLEDALNVVRKSPRSRAGREAREWIASHDASWPFAFERICEAFDIEPEDVRRQVAQRKPMRVPVLPIELARLAESA